MNLTNDYNIYYRENKTPNYWIIIRGYLFLSLERWLTGRVVVGQNMELEHCVRRLSIKGLPWRSPPPPFCNSIESGFNWIRNEDQSVQSRFNGQPKRFGWSLFAVCGYYYGLWLVVADTDVLHLLHWDTLNGQDHIIMDTKRILGPGVLLLAMCTAMSTTGQSEYSEVKSQVAKRTPQQHQMRLGSFTNESDLWRNLKCFFESYSDDPREDVLLVKQTSINELIRLIRSQKEYQNEKGRKISDRSICTGIKGTIYSSRLFSVVPPNPRSDDVHQASYCTCRRICQTLLSSKIRLDDLLIGGGLPPLPIWPRILSRNLNFKSTILIEFLFWSIYAYYTLPSAAWVVFGTAAAPPSNRLLGPPRRSPSRREHVHLKFTIARFRRRKWFVDRRRAANRQLITIQYVWPIPREVFQLYLMCNWREFR